MPVLFIHGVNVRDRYQNENDALAMGELLVERVIRPLARAGIGRFATLRLDPLLMRIAYWGDEGVKFRWASATVPKLRATDVLGGEEDPSVPSHTQVIALADLLNQDFSGPTPEQPLLQAARTDFPLFVDIVLTPLIESEVRLVEDPALYEHADESDKADEPDKPDEIHAWPQPIGPVMEAWLVTAADQVANDAELKQRIDTEINSDEELIDEVEKQLLDRFRKLASEHNRAEAPQSAGVDVLGGGLGGTLREASDRVKEFFVRAAQSPLRVPSVVGLKALRGRLNSEITRFTGDVFEYLSRRGDSQKPGRIVQVVLAELDAALNRRPGEPLIVITHSMGGNIFYDILTHYRPELEVDVWLSVGGQVGLFEEMKLFHASDPKVQAPQKVDQLGSRVNCWLNVYDPADPAAFLAEPVFARVKDVRFSTGAGDYHTHLNYFKRLRLYRALHSELEEALKK